MCQDDCTVESSACPGGWCGDGIQNGLEQCDQDDMVVACHPGFGAIECDAECLRDDSGCFAYCGDGSRNGPEVCDGDDTPCSCPGGTVTCINACTELDMSMCPGGCS